MQRLRKHRVFVAGATLALSGCGAGAAPECETLACASQRFFGAEAAALSDCEGAVPSALGVEVDVELLYSSSLAPGDVARLTRAAATYYAEYETSLRLVQAPLSLELGPLIAGSRGEIEQALVDAGLPIDAELDAEQAALVDAITAEILLAPLREHVRERGVPRRPLVSLVVLERLAAPSLYDEGLLSGSLDGLGFSPELVARLRESGDAAGSFDALDLPTDFTPMLFLDVEALSRFEHPDNVVAHELGHALGLLHTDEPGNLMSPEVAESCRAWLSPEQAAQIAESVAR